MTNFDALSTRVDKMNDELVEARIEIKSQGTQLSQIKTDIGGLHTKMDKLTDHMLQSAGRSSVWWRSMAFKLLLILIGAGGLGVGVKVMLSDSRPAQAKVASVDMGK